MGGGFAMTSRAMGSGALATDSVSVDSMSVSSSSGSFFFVEFQRKMHRAPPLVSMSLPASRIKKAAGGKTARAVPEGRNTHKISVLIFKKFFLKRNFLIFRNICCWGWKFGAGAQPDTV